MDLNLRLDDNYPDGLELKRGPEKKKKTEFPNPWSVLENRWEDEIFVAFWGEKKKKRC